MPRRSPMMCGNCMGRTTGRRHTTSRPRTRRSLRSVQRLWLIEAVKYNVVPLDDRSFERFDAGIAGRPQLITGTTQTLFSGMRLLENCVLNIKNKSHTVTASITVPEGGAAGVI